MFSRAIGPSRPVGGRMLSYQYEPCRNNKLPRSCPSLRCRARLSVDEPRLPNRSLRVATKLCSELIIAEYMALYGLRAVINRCGVLAGPWQMGKVDQGFVVLWAAQHLFGGALSYNGFGGAGLQVRDALHVEDLCRLVRDQAAQIATHRGKTYNVGGGAERSVSLAEL